MPVDKVKALSRKAASVVRHGSETLRCESRSEVSGRRVLGRVIQTCRVGERRYAGLAGRKSGQPRFLSTACADRHGHIEPTPLSSRIHNLRFRRVVDGSPMVEVRNPFQGCLTSVFGDSSDCSPMVEVTAGWRCRLSSFFGEWLIGSPMAEVWGRFRGSVTSVFGDSRIVSPMREVRGSF